MSHFPSWYIPSLKAEKTSSTTPRPLIIWLRGNGKIIYRLIAIKGIQDRLDVDVALINYRGSFEELSRNQVTRTKIRSDNQVAMAFLEQHFSYKEYFIYGLSIGSAICSDLVLDNMLNNRQNRRDRMKLKGVILDNVFTSLSDSFVVNIRNASAGARVPTFAASIVSKAILAFCGET